MNVTVQPVHSSPSFHTWSKRSWKAASIFSLAALTMAAGCNRSSTPGASAAPAGGAPQGPPPVAVSVAASVQKDVPQYIDEIGRTIAVEKVEVQPQVTGKILKIWFTDGADVKKGDHLFTIDPAPFQAVLDQAQATLVADQAQLKFANQELARVKQLRALGTSSPQDMDQKTNAVDVAAAKINEAKAQVETAQLNLGYTEINSPIDGRVGQHQVDVGNVVTANSNAIPLVTIQRLDPIYVDFTVAENDLPAVRSNMSGGTLIAQVRVPGDTEGRSGDLTFLDNAVDASTGTVKLRATLKNADRHFWPGELVNVRLILKTLKNAVLVPNEAVQIAQQGPFVYMIQTAADGPTVAVQPVKLGQRQGDLIVLTDGLKPGAQVVTQGQMMLYPGAHVMVAADQSSTTAPAGKMEANASGETSSQGSKQ